MVYKHSGVVSASIKMKLESALEHVNQNLLNIQYAVRGPIVARAAEIENELKKGVKKPFDRVVRANIGDSHALGQAPFTFIRQVQALAAYPHLFSSPDIPDDAKERAREILADCTNGSVGAYSPSQGLLVVRRRAAEYLSARDGVPAFPEQVYLGSGATDLIKAVLSLFAGEVLGKPSSVMIPIPQYPVFSATLAELGIQQAHYYLDEAHNWALMEDELERSWAEASKTSAVRALVVINPGNPTGQVLTRQNMEEIIKFAHRRHLFLLADEVYQENIVSKPFLSFKKVMHDMGAPYSDTGLASFMTASKGWAAECGARAGLAELALTGAARKAFEAARAVAQCPNLLGQCALDCIMKPPAPGEPSYEQFAQELAVVRQTLRERTATAYQKLNSIPTFSCNPIDASMFAFPRFLVPARALAAARAQGVAPDEFYCLRLLEETGVCVVPGSGFGQAEGSLHFRTTILHPREEFSYMMEQIASFHVKFLKEFEDERSEG